MPPTYKFFEQEIEKFVSAILPPTYFPQKVRANKVIRDAIWGFNLCYKHEINIIDSPLVQRLRNLFQTSLTLFTYPSAVHSRFEHSLGVVSVAHKMLTSINEKLKQKNKNIEQHQWAEVRLAALLHDCGHTPFSHGSEEYYKINPIFDLLSTENKKLFGTAAPHEILSYFIVRSMSFQSYWGKICKLYDDGSAYCDLTKISLERVALFILGKNLDGEDTLKYLAQVINGPFDADKLDYLSRDGYFTGLQLQIDIERLLLALNVWPEENTLCIDVSGVAALEQVLFSKMQIFHSVYHHHKVRAALSSLHKLFDMILDNPQTMGIDISDSLRKDSNGRKYPNPFAFLYLDDYDIFSRCNVNCQRGVEQNNCLKINNHISSIKNRELLKRALVLSIGTIIADADSNAAFASFRDPSNRATVEQVRKLIANDSGVEICDIVIDIPGEPRFEKISRDAQVKLTDTKIVPLEDAFPTRGWVTGYITYKYNVYLLAPASVCPKVAQSAIKIFKNYCGINLKPDAVEQAKHGV